MGESLSRCEVQSLYMTNWERWIERRKQNIGLVRKYYKFTPPTEAEKAASLAIEIQSWQASKGTRLEGWKVSDSYSDPKGHGINLLRTREPEGKLDGPEYTKAINAYITTPMDHHNILKSQGIDVSIWEEKPSIFSKMFWKAWDYLMKQTDPEYEYPDRTRLTEEFIDMMTFKEKK